MVREVRARGSKQTDLVFRESHPFISTTPPTNRLLPQPRPLLAFDVVAVS